MPEENKNLEISMKRSWLFRIGLVFLILALVLFLLIFVLPNIGFAGENRLQANLAAFSYLFGGLGVILIIAHKLSKLIDKNRGILLFGKIILVVILIIFTWFWLVTSAKGTELAYNYYSRIGAITKSEFTCSILPSFLEPYRTNWFCYLEVAKQKRDLTICDNKATYYLQLTGCYSDIARITKNEAICEKIPDTPYDPFDTEEKDYCYKKLAETKKDEALCAKIKINFIRSSCYEILK